MSRRRGLGSGLDALIPGTAASSDAVRQLPVDLIRQNRSQPRSHFDEQLLDELASSIRSHGVIQPVIVSAEADGRYELIAGERRWRAAQRAGLREIPALVKSATPQQLLELALVENVQRADLNPLEEGLAYQSLKDEFGLSDEQIAQRVGKSRVAIVNARRLIRLSATARQALLDGMISAGHGRALLRVEDPALQQGLLTLLLRQKLSVREAEQLAELVLQTALIEPARQALIAEAISLAQAQSLLRVEDPGSQQQALDLILAHGLGARESERLSDLIAEGLSPRQALASLRPQPAAASAAAAPAARPAPPAKDISPEDAEAQRLFEALLETPVALRRVGREIRLTITVFDDEQLQGLYERLGGEG